MLGVFAVLEERVIAALGAQSWGVAMSVHSAA